MFNKRFILKALLAFYAICVGQLTTMDAAESKTPVGTTSSAGISWLSSLANKARSIHTIGTGVDYMKRVPAMPVFKPVNVVAKYTVVAPAKGAWALGGALYNEKAPGVYTLFGAAVGLMGGHVAANLLQPQSLKAKVGLYAYGMCVGAGLGEIYVERQAEEEALRKKERDKQFTDLAEAQRVRDEELAKQRAEEAAAQRLRDEALARQLAAEAAAQKLRDEALARQLEEQEKKFQDQLTTVDTKATQATTAANEAKTQAIAAKTSADTAATQATLANTTAGQAKASADGALGKATDAERAAQLAKEAALEADKTATKILSKVETFQQQWQALLDQHHIKFSQDQEVKIRELLDQNQQLGDRRFEILTNALTERLADQHEELLAAVTAKSGLTIGNMNLFVVHTGQLGDGGATAQMTISPENFQSMMDTLQRVLHAAQSNRPRALSASSVTDPGTGVQGQLMLAAAAAHSQSAPASTVASSRGSSNDVRALGVRDSDEDSGHGSTELVRKD